MGAPRILWLAVLAGWSALATTASALDFDVSNPAEFQAALTTAQSNGQEDTINVLPCVLGEPGCTTLTDPVTNQSVVAYEFSTPLTYIAASTENFSLTIDGFDSDTRILAGDAAQILFIDTTAATDTGQTVWVRNLTFALGLPEAGDGGAVAIRVAGAFVQVSGSEFYGNRADNGGALFIAVTGASEAPIRLVDLTFEGNSARDSGGAAMVLATEFVNVEVRDIDFIGNNAVGGGGCLFVQNLEAGDGPIRVNEVLVDDVTFEQCEAGLDGGGAYLAANATTIRVSGFVENEAGGVGGGLFLEGGWGFLNVVNSGFAFNTAQSGGGMYTNPPVPFGDGTPNLINNTFVENRATNDGGNLYLAVGGTTAIARIYNNILFGGTTASATTGDDVYINNNPFEDIPSRVEFYNNAITALPSGGFPNTNDSFFISGPSALVSGGNIDDPPQLLLTSGEGDEVSPDQQPTSPTIDAGRNDLVTAAFGVAIPNVDYAGDTRPQNGIVDIGMDEFLPDATPTADLSVTATDSPDPVTEGGGLTYQATVANAGPDAATGVVLDVDFDDGVEFASATVGQGTCTPSEDLASVSCALGTIADGDDVAVTIVVTVPEVLEPTTITAGFLVGNDAQFEPDLSNNEALVGTTVVPAGPAQADLVVTKNAAPDPFVSRSGELTYTVTVQNNGPDAATGVVVSDELPEGVTFVSATASNEGFCSGPGAGNTLTCEIGSLGLTENATVTIVVVPDEVTEPTTIVNTASVTGNEIDPNGENDASGVETTIEPPRADLSVTVTASSASPPIDTAVTYTVTISSAGPSDSEDVVLTVDLPPGTELSSVTSATGSCSVGTSSIICTFEALAAGESEIVELVLVMPGTTGILRLDATVSSDTSDPTGTNDTASQEVNVIDTIDLVIRGEGGSGSAVGWPMLVFGGLLLAFSRRRGQSPAVLAAVIGATVLLAPVGARAEGWYLSAGVGQASAGADAGDLASDLAARGWTIRDVSVDDTDAAWRLGLGFEFTEHFSLEGGYVDLGDATSRYGASVRPTEIDAILTDTFEVHPYLGKGWTLGAAGRFPLGASPVSLVVRGGFFLWEADIEVEVVSGGSGRVDGSENGTDGYYGAGLEFRLQPQVRVTLDWDRYRLDDWVDVPTLGLRLSF